MALSLFMAGLPVGVAASYFVSGRVAASHGWRAAFWIAALPGILCAAAALGLREPRRGASESGAPRAATPPAGTGVAPYLKLLSLPTLWWVIASGALHNFNMYAVGAFLSPYLMRYHELDVRQANDIAMVAAGLAGLPGLYVGGLVADRAYRRRRNGRLLAAALASAASAPLVYLALSRPPGDIAAFTVLMALGSALMYAYYSMVYATIQDIVAPASRGSAMALYFFAMYVLGASLGPVGTGMLSDLFTRRAAETAGVTAADASALAPFRAEGLHTAMYIVPLLGLLLAAVLFAGARTVERDIERSRA
jgi:predicted MFS family arabinose efflux permease